MEKLTAGNWKEFGSFAWFEQPEDAENWAIWYTHNRGSGLMAECNAAIIAKEMKKFKKDVREEHHSHWACGWIEGYSIRMVDSKGRPTKAGEAANEFIHRMDNYPLLDEDAYYKLVDDKINELSAFDLKCIAEYRKIKTKAETREGLLKVIDYEFLQEWVES